MTTTDEGEKVRRGEKVKPPQELVMEIQTRKGSGILRPGIRDVGLTKTLHLDWISQSPSFYFRLPSIVRV